MSDDTSTPPVEAVPTNPDTEEHSHEEEDEHEHSEEKSQTSQSTDDHVADVEKVSEKPHETPQVPSQPPPQENVQISSEISQPTIAATPKHVVSDSVDQPAEKSRGDLQREIDILNRKVSELSSKLILKEDQNKNLQTEFHRVSDQLSSANNKAAEESKKALDLDSQLILLKRKLKKEEEVTKHTKPAPDFAYNTALTDASASTATTPATATSAEPDQGFSKLVSRNAELHENLRHATQDLERAELEKKELDTKCKELAKTIQSQQDQIASITLKQQEQQGQIQQLQNNLDNEKKRREETEARDRASMEQVEKLGLKAAQSEELAKEAEKLRQQNSDLEKKLEDDKISRKELEGKLEHSVAELAEMKAIVDHSKLRSDKRHEQQVSQLQNEVEQEKQRADSLQKEVERVKTTLKEAQAAQQSGKASEIASGRSVTTLQKKMKTSDRRTEDLQAEITVQKTEIARLGDIVQQGKKDHSKLFLEKCDLESQCSKLKHELELAKGRLELALNPTVYPKPETEKPAKTEKKDEAKAKGDK